MRHTLIPLALLSALHLPLAGGETDPAGDLAQPPVAEGDAGDAAARARVARGQAGALTRQGVEQVRLYNQDKNRHPTAIVDAAIAFGKARELLEGSEDQDAIAEVQANLFWCKKQMNLDALKDYVARKGGDGQMALRQMDAVAAVKPDATEAGAYLARAEAFASRNPEDHLQIAIRFLEVAERFPGANEGTEANKRALAAQQALMKQTAELAAAGRQTRFTKPVTVVAGATAIPSATAQKDALAQLKKAFAKPYARRDAIGKRNLGRKLLAEAPKNKTDPALFHQMLVEAVRCASESEDYDTLLTACEQLAASFAGVDVVTEKLAALKKAGSRPVAQAISKLLEKGADPAANLVAGKWFAFSAFRWGDALPMLVLGADAELAKVAQMELDKPANAEERLQVADAWYELYRKATAKEDKGGMSARAMNWYQQAVKGMQGLAKERVDKRIAELDKVIPLDLNNIDWENLTATQWDKLKGRTLTVNARVDRFESGVSLGAGERVRIVAHPTDTWTIESSWEGRQEVGWRGYVRTYQTSWSDGSTTTHAYSLDPGEFNTGALTAWIGAGPKQVGGIVSGPGVLFFAMHTRWGTKERTGTLRVKLLPVTDDE